MEQLCSARDIAQPCGVTNVALGVSALFDRRASELLAEIAANEGFSLLRKVLPAIDTNPTNIVDKTLLFAIMVPPEVAQLYVDLYGKRASLLFLRVTAALMKADGDLEAMQAILEDQAD